MEATSMGAMDMEMPTNMGEMHMEMPTKAARVSYAQVLKPDGWVVTASSTARGRSARAVLGRKDFWESARLGGAVRLPQSLTVRFPRSTVVSSLTYVPHGAQDVIGHFVVRLSTNGKQFGKPVAYGTWQANKNFKRVGWVPQAVRAVRLTVLSLSSSRSRAVAIARIELTGAEQHVNAARGNAADARAAKAGKSGAGSTNPSLVGEWGPTIAFPLIPVAAALIPGDKLIVWSADSINDFNATNEDQYTQTAILNLATGTVSSATVSNTAHDMFCPGASILPNGEVIVTGGIGNTDTSIYDPTTNTWRAGPHMNIGRGYQGQATLSDGQVFVLGGSWSGGIGGKLGEIWSSTAAWRELTGVPANPIYTNDSAGVYRADNHGWFIPTSGDRIFQAGPSAEMHWITTTGEGTITPAGLRGTSGDEMNGNAVLYDVNKILTVGGAPSYEDSNATNVANVVDIASNTPTVTATAPMKYYRAFANSVVLPTGKVFTVGGQSYAVPFSDETADLFPEMWDPSTGTWTEMAEEAEPRVYHSVAVLLPDGTVFSGGGGLCGECSTNHPDGQIFYPPYLFNANGSRRKRPEISSAPSSAQTGQTISVTTGESVSSFVMMRYGEATHTVDNDQRRIPLPIVSHKGHTYQLAIPSDPGIALPGPYMLFAINAKGTPSVSATIFISTPTEGTPTTAYGKQIYADGPALYWPLSDASGSGAANDLSGNRDTGAFTSSGISYQTPSPVEGSGGEGLTLSGGQVISTQPQMTPGSYSEELWFRTSSKTGGMLATYGDSATGSNDAEDRSVYMTETGQIDFGTWTGVTNVISSTGAYNDGRWHFLVATQGSDGMHLFVDGVQVASGSETEAQSYLGYWQVGGPVKSGWPNGPSTAFSGSISDAALYLTELTPAQILAQYEASPAAGAPGGLQSITFTSVPPKSPSVDGTYTVSATGGASGKPVTFRIDPASTSGACTSTGTNGSMITFTGYGTCVIDANQAGNANYEAAEQVQQSVTIGTPSGYHSWVIAGDGLCMDVTGASVEAGAVVEQWTCNGGDNQEFQFVPGSGAYGELQGENSGDDVAVAESSTTAGVPDIIQQVPNGAANGLWLPKQQSDGSWQFQNENSGLCLEVYEADDNPGQALDQSPCKNEPGDYQDFTAE
jgi:galactose oxidase